MRVISGQKRGKKLESLKGDSVRPTTDKVKESIFNVIQFELIGSNFLDLFAGSGQIGIEALSRGAKHVTFVDYNKDSISLVKKNLMSTDLLKNSEIIHMNSVLFLKKSKDLFNIAFLDPPYNSDVLNEALTLLPRAMDTNGIIICEHPLEVELPGNLEFFYLYRVYKYGKIAVSVYKTQ